ncbi:MAG: hypothetical protein PHW46_01680 [Candidatus Omnitrophica bacterium]|nr:hypothetical protein [Candidatus Omnitrophota bacterium]
MPAITRKHLSVKNMQTDSFICPAAMVLLAIFCFCYSIFGANFAETSIQFYFLNFPVFAGEILFALCVILFLLEFKRSSKRINKKGYLLLIYVGFILIKSFHGYFNWGPLAFRNAALFYYVLFALFGYIFFDVNILKKKYVFFTNIAIITLCLIFRLVDAYFVFTYLMLFLVLVDAVGFKKLQFIAISLMVLFFPYKSLFFVHRGVLFAEIAAVIFLLVAMCNILKIKKSIKIVLVVFVLCAFSAMAFMFVDKGAIKPFLNPGIILKQFYAYESKIDQISRENETENAKEEEGKLRLYDPDNSVKRVPQLAYKSGNQERRYMGSVNNIYWRMFLWKEMSAELLNNRNIFGLDFGKPFRPKSVKILRWSSGIGWLEPHNSYLHMLYRAGVFGVVLVLVLCFFFARATYSFIRKRCIKGVMLSSILLYWLVVSNFEVIFELPYFAIPFWSLFGMVLKYSNSKMQVKGE